MSNFFIKIHLNKLKNESSPEKILNFIKKDFCKKFLEQSHR